MNRVSFWFPIVDRHHQELLVLLASCRTQRWQCWRAAMGAWLLVASGSTGKKQKNVFKSRDVAQFAECLLSMHGALASILSTT